MGAWGLLQPLNDSGGAWTLEAKVDLEGSRWLEKDLKAPQAFLGGVVSGKPTQGPFQLYRGLGAWLY